MELTYYDLQRLLSDIHLSRGRAYQRDGRVLSSHRTHRGDQDIITGDVLGSGKSIYEVYTRVEKDPLAGIEIDGDCSCPVGYNCKHVAAVLLEELEKQTPGDRSAGSSTAGSVDDLPLYAWLSRLEEATKPKSPPEIARTHGGSSQRLVYVLDRRAHAASTSRVVVDVLRCRLLKKGGYGKPSVFDVYRGWDPLLPAYIRPEDVNILRTLQPNPYTTGMGVPALRGRDGGRLLETLLETGRCHWRDKDSPALTVGELRQVSVEWQIGDDGLQRLVFIAQPAIGEVLPLAPPWYVDLERWACGPMDTGLVPSLAEALADAPALQPEQAQRLGPMLAEKIPNASIPRPQAVEVKDAASVHFAPCLRLLTEDVPMAMGGYGYLSEQPVRLTTARVSYDYGGARVAPTDHSGVLLVNQGKGLLRICRDLEAEAEAYRALSENGLVPVGAQFPQAASVNGADLIPASYGEQDDASAWLSFQAVGLPGLRAQGWRVEIDPSFAFTQVEPQEWYAELEENDGGDWFDLELGVVIDGERVALLPLLLEWLRSIPEHAKMQTLREVEEDTPVNVYLPDGRILSMPGARVHGIVQTLLELFDPDVAMEGGKLRLSAWRAVELEHLERAAVDSAASSSAQWRWFGGERVRDLAQRLRDFEGIESVPVPETFQATLRPYQQQGLNWLQFLREYGLAGILADDMGLGKTVQTLAHLLIEKLSGRMDLPSLVVAPTSLMANWRVETERFAPQLRVLTLQGLNRKEHFDAIARFDLVLTTYPLLFRDQEVLLGHEYHLLILDEAQIVKNPKSQAAQIVQQMMARHRLCLTGTPMENHLGELWSLFHFLQPGLLGEQRQFRRLFRTPIEKQQNEQRHRLLVRRVAPFLLRRTKGEVLVELPPKTEILRYVELESAQRDLYESIRVAMHHKVREAISKRGLERSHIVILDALLKLRQVCCDPRLLKLERAQAVKESAKLQLLMDMVPEMVEEGRRMLLFSQFTSMLSLIEDQLKKRRLSYVQLTGKTQDRSTPIRRFQEGEVSIFLISLKAGGTGLNLTAADTVIHYDPWWNPAVENQATDRAHRIGQDKKVFVYKLLTKGTVEEKMLAMQQHKQELADALYAEKASGVGELRREDLDALFEPLQ